MMHAPFYSQVFANPPIYSSYHTTSPTQEKFISTLEIVIRKQSTQSVTIDCEWISEKEMKDDKGWSQFLVWIMYVMKLVTQSHARMQ